MSNDNLNKIIYDILKLIMKIVILFNDTSNVLTEILGLKKRKNFQLFIDVETICIY